MFFYETIYSGVILSHHNILIGWGYVFAARHVCSIECAFDLERKCLMSRGGFAPALALNADFRPLNYFPLSLWSWQDTVKAVWSDRVTIISEYDQQISSPSLKMNLPSVIALKEYVPQTRNPAFTRFNVFLRDRFSCQYCGNGFVASELTFDHVIPKSRGGRTSWTNVVAACGPCNLRKANKMPGQSGMHPLATPVRQMFGNYRKMGGRFRRIICMSLGVIICIGTPNYSRMMMSLPRIFQQF